MAKYIKIPTDFFDSEPIRTIANSPDGDSAIVLYLHLLCQTHKGSAKGVFSIGNISLTDEVLQSVFMADNISGLLELLELYGLIKRNKKEVFVYKPWADLHDRNSVRYREWRTAVFVRDGFRCVKCGATKNIQAHHIKAWKKNKELRYIVSNGTTLCRECHLEAHGGCWRNG